MWKVIGTNLNMTEKDFGLVLPTTFSGTTLTANDTLLFTFKDKKNGETILTKSFTGIVDNTFDFVLTEADSDLLPVGSYVYSCDWYQDGAFMCNIVECGELKVGDKA